MTRKKNIIIKTMDLVLIEARGEHFVVRGGEIDIAMLDRKDLALMELLADSTSKTHPALPSVDRVPGGFRLGFAREAFGNDIAGAWTLHCGTEKTATLLADLKKNGMAQIEFAEGASHVLSPMEASEISVDPDILRAAYGVWEEHPAITHSDWQNEVANLDTVQGYWEYVAHTLEARAEIDSELTIDEPAGQP